MEFVVFGLDRAKAGELWHTGHRTDDDRTARCKNNEGESRIGGQRGNPAQAILYASLS